MSPAFQSLGIDRLSTAEIEKIPLSAAQQEEIDRRLAEHQANPNGAIPWQQAEADALVRLRSSQDD